MGTCMFVCMTSHLIAAFCACVVSLKRLSWPKLVGINTAAAPPLYLQGLYILHSRL